MTGKRFAEKTVDSSQSAMCANYRRSLRLAVEVSDGMILWFLDNLAPTDAEEIEPAMADYFGAEPRI